MTKLACLFHTHKYKEDYVKVFIKYLENKYPNQSTLIRFKGTYDDFVFYIEYEINQFEIPKSEIVQDYENLHNELGKWIDQCMDILIKKEIQSKI